MASTRKRFRGPDTGAGEPAGVRWKRAQRGGTRTQWRLVHWTLSAATALCCCLSAASCGRGGGVGC